MPEHKFDLTPHTQFLMTLPNGKRAHVKVPTEEAELHKRGFQVAASRLNRRIVVSIKDLEGGFSHLDIFTLGPRQRVLIAEELATAQEIKEEVQRQARDSTKKSQGRFSSLVRRIKTALLGWKRSRW